ncbi:MAG TPA: hypothetical protein VGL12_15355 [Roseiarcus sp.]|jgi:hypothetical protein
MPNPNAPFGFADSHRLGAAVNYQMAKRWIAAANPTPIFTGDPIVQLSTGYIAQAAPGVTQIGGIFVGCEYMSVSQKKWIASPWWPGNDAVASGSGFDVHAKIIDDPLTVFRVQGNGQITLAMIGMNGQFAIGSGNSVTGKSGATLDVVTSPPAVTATFPFRIVDLVRDPPGSAGADPTSAYNWAYVTFNNQDYKSLTGI